MGGGSEPTNHSLLPGVLCNLKLHRPVLALSIEVHHVRMWTTETGLRLS